MPEAVDTPGLVRVQVVLCEPGERCLWLIELSRRELFIILQPIGSSLWSEQRSDAPASLEEDTKAE